MSFKFTRDIERDLLDRHQGLLEVEGEFSRYILMSMDVFRETMGVGTDEELRASVEALKSGMNDVRSGRTRPLTDALNDLAPTDDLPG